LAIGAFGEDKDEPVEACCANITANRIGKQSGCILLSILLHNRHACEKAMDLETIGVHESYCEKNFIQDLYNKKKFWLPTVFEGCVIQLHALHVLVYNPDSILGLSAKAHMEKFCAAMKKQIVIPPLKGEQIVEIVHLLKWINDEIESDNIGASGKVAIDPFNTELNILAVAEAAGTTTATTGATATATAT
jgi:hypothetical protein